MPPRKSVNNNKKSPAFGKPTVKRNWFENFSRRDTSFIRDTTRSWLAKRNNKWAPKVSDIPFFREVFDQL